jgi:hypothetical protein
MEYLKKATRARPILSSRVNLAHVLSCGGNFRSPFRRDFGPNVSAARSLETVRKTDMTE